MVVGAIVGILLNAIFNMFVIFIVGKLKLGMEVRNLGTAFMAALIIGVLGFLVGLVVDPMIAQESFPLWAKYVVHFVIAALVVYIAGKMLKGMTTEGFSGAIIAAIAIAVVYWLINLILTGMF